MFGRPDVAAKAKLWIVAGGNHDQIEHCRSILEAMSWGILIVSTDPSLANLVKIAGNFTITAVYESYGTQIAQQRFDPALFALKLGVKDIRLVRQAADEADVPMPLVNLVYEHMLSAIAHGRAEQEWSSFAQVNAENAGLKSLDNSSAH